jgi:hypothetical protein
MIYRQCICCKKFYGAVPSINTGITGGLCYRCFVLLSLQRVFKRLSQLVSSDYLLSFQDMEDLVSQVYTRKEVK